MWKILEWVVGSVLVDVLSVGWGKRADSDRSRVLKLISDKKLR